VNPVPGDITQPFCRLGDINTGTYVSKRRVKFGFASYIAQIRPIVKEEPKRKTGKYEAK
jgi:hypothetical protein